MNSYILVIGIWLWSNGAGVTMQEFDSYASCEKAMGIIVAQIEAKSRPVDFSICVKK